MRKCYAFLLVLLLSWGTVQANNLTVSNVRLTNNTGSRADILFDIQWDNSWRDATNWDAAWVFVKYRAVGSTTGWSHATLGFNQPQTPAGVAWSDTNDGTGLLLHRAGTGSGSFAAAGVRVTWNAAAQGLSLNTGSSYEIKVYATEMVYIPEGAFNLNSTKQAALEAEFQRVAGSLTQLTSEAALPAGAIRWAKEGGGGGSGNEITVGDTIYAGSAALSAAYPKGVGAQYCMKYELSQGQYTDFLNALSRTQQIRRVPVNIANDSPAGGATYVMANASTAAGAQRNTITCPASGMGTTLPVVFSCARPDRAANFLIWADGAAYLDWAGLAPMTELQYEKICRGPEPAVASEYAWGNASITAARTISGTENGTETTDIAANCAYNNETFAGGDGGAGPLRCGIFARAATTRQQSGATYYGVMEMTANCWERCVTVAAQDGGRPTNAGLFDGSPGDGALAATGEHNQLTWPNSTDVLGSNFRGGNWSRPDSWAAVSDRRYGGSALADRTSHRSIRGVRTMSGPGAPSAPTGSGTGFSSTKFQGGAFDGYDSSAPALVQAVRNACATCGQVRAVVLPHPVAETAVLRLSGRPTLHDATLTLRDALGRTVRQVTHLKGLDLPVNRAGLAPGLYFYEVHQDGEVVVNPGRLVVE
ncbi:hypothetical protein MTX78_07825 [Hymenobacter tibetensis]|uniref:Sulfatase-modifying factor enzyme domain-containing protein n=1 Tax=Hymenobacter tibetensis TaxID=497967 RepID=A0ABY4D394_9BACT|nr:hypothetical protein [Hymenobacter tibetensis]UOG76497.1 hypothetical protein MTX78_07825 [Hymenobacter tibetensis]